MADGAVTAANPTYHGNVLAAAVNTVTLPGQLAVSVTNRSTSDPLWIRCDGTAPAAAGAGSYVALPGDSLEFPGHKVTAGTVKVTGGAAAVDYSVELL